jgi:DNA-binding NtrC family response regulator
MRQLEADATAVSPTVVCGIHRSESMTEGDKRGCAQILSVSPYVSDHKILYEILNGSHWKLATVWSWLEAFEHLGKHSYLAVFCEYSWADGTWRDLLQRVSGGRKLPIVVVMSRAADEGLWAKVIELGAYDLLAKPLNVRDVLDVLTSAYQYRTGPPSHGSHR